MQVMGGIVDVAGRQHHRLAQALGDRIDDPDHLATAIGAVLGPDTQEGGTSRRAVRAIITVII